VVGCSLGGERWDEKKEKEETEEESVGRGVVYNGFYRWNPRRIHSVGDSIGDSAMSLYGYLSLNPSVIPSVKSSEKTPHHHAVASSQTKCVVRRYIPKDFETEFNPSVIPLVFAGFLVVNVITK